MDTKTTTLVSLDLMTFKEKMKTTPHSLPDPLSAHHKELLHYVKITSGVVVFLMCLFLLWLMYRIVRWVKRKKCFGSDLKEQTKKGKKEKSSDEELNITTRRMEDLTLQASSSSIMNPTYDENQYESIGASPTDPHVIFGPASSMVEFRKRPSPRRNDDSRSGESMELFNISTIQRSLQTRQEREKERKAKEMKEQEMKDRKEREKREKDRKEREKRYKDREEKKRKMSEYRV